MRARDLLDEIYKLELEWKAKATMADALGGPEARDIARGVHLAAERIETKIAGCDGREGLTFYCHKCRSKVRLAY